MAKYLYVDRDINVLIGRDAELALQKENDQEFLSADSGITRVSTGRWQTAQAAERKHWIEKGLDTADDRNYDHFIQFGRYNTLRGLSFDSAIELGCGPFTNMRLIADICRVRECALLDPLIEDYFGHPNCAYTRNALLVENTREPLVLKRMRAKIMPHFPALRRWWPRSTSCAIPVSRIIASPIELMPTDWQYDLLVIVNVIEHCYDIYQIFANILAVMKKDAFIVFHDVLYDHEAVKQSIRALYDAAHPLQVDKQLLNRFLVDNFSPVYYRTVVCPYTCLGQDMSYEAISFIGKKI